MNPSMNKVKKEDLFSIDQFFKNQFQGEGRYGTMGHFYWKIFLNPNNGSFINAISNNQDIVATTSITVKKIKLFNEILNIGEIGDTYTDSKFQGRGYFSKLVNESSDLLKDGNIAFLYGTPNDQSLPAYLKGTKFSTSTSINVHSFSYFLSIKNRLKPHIGSLISNIINFCFLNMEPILFFLNDQLRKNINYKVTAFILNPIAWDIFWLAASKEWDFIHFRDSKSIQWRFFKNPEKYKFILVEENDQIIGYLIYKVVLGEKTNSFQIADFLFLKNKEDALYLCFRKLRTVAKRDNIDRISIWCESKNVYAETIRKIGFIKGNKKEVIINNISKLRNLENIKSIHFTLSDTDNI